METLLNIFSDLILFTAGIVVALLWIIVFAVIAIETHDLIFGESTADDEDDEA